MCSLGCSLRTGAIILSIGSIIGGLSWFSRTSADIWSFEDNSKSLTFSFAFLFLLLLVIKFFSPCSCSYYSSPAWWNLNTISNTDVAFCIVAGILNIAAGEKLFLTLCYSFKNWCL